VHKRIPLGAGMGRGPARMPRRDSYCANELWDVGLYVSEFDSLEGR